MQELLAGPYQSHPWCEPPVEFREARRTQTLDFPERRGGVAEQRRHVHALALWGEGRQIPRPAREHVDRAVMVQAAQMMKGHSDLEDALIQVTDVASLRAPQPLQRLVLLEKLAAIELRDAIEQRLRRGLVTRHGVILMT